MKPHRKTARLPNTVMDDPRPLEVQRLCGLYEEACEDLQEEAGRFLGQARSSGGMGEKEIAELMKAAGRIQVLLDLWEEMWVNSRPPIKVRGHQ